MSRNIVVEKARQQGFTEVFAGIRLFYFSTIVPVTSVYALPIDQKAREVARDRIYPLGLSSSRDRFTSDIISLFDQWETLMHKHVRTTTNAGMSSILFSHSWNEAIGETTAADLLYLDEFDRMRANVVSAFSESLASSSLGFKHIWSTPTVPKHGVNFYYEKSDQKVFMFKCQSCGYWQHITEDNVFQVKGSDTIKQRLYMQDPEVLFDDGTFIFGCIRCNNVLDRMNAKAEWVPRSAEVRKQWSGYKTSQADCVWHSADSIMRKLPEMRPGKGPWLRYVWGTPYSGDFSKPEVGIASKIVNRDLKIPTSKEDLDEFYKGYFVSLGVDWGDISWYVLTLTSQEIRIPTILSVGRILKPSDPDENIVKILNIHAAWGAKICIADVGYGADRNPKLWKVLKPFFYGCQYVNSKGNVVKGTSAQPVFDRIQKQSYQDFPKVRISNVESLKSIFEDLKHGRISSFLLDARLTEILDSHLRNVSIFTDIDDKGEITEEIKKLGPDHLLHALNYSLIGQEWRKLYGTNFVGDIALEPKDEIRNTGMPTYEDISEYLELFGEDIF